MKVTDKITITNEDNMALMARYPDNHFDLSICDPPYGIEEGKKSRGMGTCAMAGNYDIKDWDNEIPSDEYFKELKRVSKNQIIWGANYMTEFLPPSMGWIFWDKDSSGDFSDGELAYTSFKRALRKVKVTWMGMRQYDMKNKETRIHPTQKPIQLYKWLLENYAKEGDKILDTHLGSMSIAIACADYGFELVGCELDPDYYNAGVKRIQNHVSQQKLF
jgi:site-specific DNA-methyltransferase (adenine-specific)